MTSRLVRSCWRTQRNLYDGVPLDEVWKAAILAARTLIEKDPGYSFATARLLLHTIAREVLGREVTLAELSQGYVDYFPQFIRRGVEAERLDEQLLQFDLPRLAAALKPERDLSFDYLGLQTLYDRYFLHVEKTRIELPQAFFMRVAMGLSLNEIDREARAIEFYQVLSSFDFMSSHADTVQQRHATLATVELLSDDGARPSGRHLRIDQGKRAAVEVRRRPGQRLDARARFRQPHQGHERRIAGCGAVLEGRERHRGRSQSRRKEKRRGLHLSGKLGTSTSKSFWSCARNTGDDRRRTHDMNTANWIPDLFMRRVIEKGDWTLFSPNDVPDLHDLFGSAFETAYVAYEEKAARGELKLHRRLPAADLWRKMLTMLFETGHPWITFKDACNIRSPQQHIGVVHSSNLCTEITLNTSDTETAVCNLGSINLKQHLIDRADGGKTLDHDRLRATIATAMRMLDNVIDINYYAVKKARDSNLRHRPVGLGLMAFQDSLYELRIPYASDAAVQFADESMEAICYYAYLASTDLAKERGRYASYTGSLWERGVLPLDTLDLLDESRGGDARYVQVDRSSKLDWAALRRKIATDGMRNSNCVAIAPTATISNIVGVDASIEPSFGNLSVKSNLSGEFTVINSYLVEDLKRHNLWDDVMVMDLKHFNGSLGPIDRVPQELKALYGTAFEVEPRWLVEAASRRQKWIDQAQSLNIYMAGCIGQEAR